MNPNAQFERDLEQWLQTQAPASAPAGFHASVIARARTLRQRPGWTTTPWARRLGRGRGITLLAAAALLGGGAVAAGSGILRLPSVVPPVPEPSALAIATTSPDATSPSPSESSAPSASPIVVAGPGGVWIPTGTMGTPRGDHTAVRLPDGRVLVMGGDPTGKSAELYDPNSGTWSSTEDMIKPRAGFPATLLADGKVLVGDIDDLDADDAVAGAEVYDPERGTWTTTGKMVLGGRGLSTATLLRDGRVLMVRSNNGAELYDPDTGAWAATGRMINPRHGHAAILLPDGRVLVAGGHLGNDHPTALAELYDPQTNSWTATAPMLAQREGLHGFLQPDGKVLVVGGPYRGLQSAELYDPATESWTATGDVFGFGGAAGETVTLLADGRVLVTGGGDGHDAAEVFDPGTGAWTDVGPTRLPHRAAPATLLLDGTVLVAGSNDCLDGVCVASRSAELYVPAGVSLPALPAFPSPAPPVFPSPTPRPTPLPPAAGPVPPNARTWRVTVDNNSSNPTTLFVADETERGTLGRLVGSVTPNVVPPRTTVQVRFTLPAKGVEGWSIFVNPRPDDGSLVGAAEIGIPGKILVTADGQVAWLSP